MSSSCINHSSFYFFSFFFLMIRRPPRSTLFPTRRSSDLTAARRKLAPHPFPTACRGQPRGTRGWPDRKSTRLNSSHRCISYAVFCLKKKKKKKKNNTKNKRIKSERSHEQ